MTEKREDKSQSNTQTHKSYDTCPHCGHVLSPWQQVLLSVDRALVCKNCWYRIILETTEDRSTVSPSRDEE